MTKSSFTHHRAAALALLTEEQNLTHKAAGFLGHVCVAPSLSDRQRDWLEKLLIEHGLPPIENGGMR